MNQNDYVSYNNSTRKYYRQLSDELNGPPGHKQYKCPKLHAEDIRLRQEYIEQHYRKNKKKEE